MSLSKIKQNKVKDSLLIYLVKKTLGTQTLQTNLLHPNCLRWLNTSFYILYVQREKGLRNTILLVFPNARVVLMRRVAGRDPEEGIFN